MEQSPLSINTSRGATGRPILVVDHDRRMREMIQWALEEENLVRDQAAGADTATPRSAPTSKSASWVGLSARTR